MNRPVPPDRPTAAAPTPERKVWARPTSGTTGGELADGRGRFKVRVLVDQGDDVIGFDLLGDPVRPGDLDDPDTMSADRKLTRKLRGLADQGLNPLTGEAGPEGRTCGECVHRTCGECVHRVLWPWHGRPYPKCELGPVSHGRKTDVRTWWPACPRFEAGSS